MRERKIPSKDKATHQIMVRLNTDEMNSLLEWREKHYPNIAIATVLKLITVGVTKSNFELLGVALTAHAYPHGYGIGHTKLNDQDELKKIDLLQTEVKKSDLLQTDVKNSDQLDLGELTIIRNTDLKKERITEPHPNRPQFLSTNRFENQEKRLGEPKKSRLEAKRAAKTKSVSEAETALSLSFLNFLNSFLGSRYRLTSSVVSMVSAILANGYSGDDIIAVTKSKCDEWVNNDVMRKFLRPKTLLKISNFENYYGALTMTAKKIDTRKEIKYTRAQVEQMKKDGNVFFCGEISDE